MKILVTGHKGFIGQNLCSFLADKDYDVIGWEYVPNEIPDPNGFDQVVHIGGISDTTYENVDQILTQNFEFSRQLLSLCDQHNVSFQYASSASVYGTCGNFKENGPVLPQSPYAWSKYLFDRYITQNLKSFSIPVQGFRYFNVYGKGEEHKGNMASPYTKFVQQAKSTGKIQLFKGSENYVRDFICVEDICEVHTQMFHIKESGIFNLGTGNPVSFEKVARAVGSKYNGAIEYIDMPKKLQSQYQSYTCADTAKLDKVIDMNWHDILDYIEKYDLDV